MPPVRVPYTEIGSYQPAIDYRMRNQIGVLEGKNFAWQASGLVSDFASHLVAQGQVLDGRGLIAHGVEIEDRYHVIVGDEVYDFLPAFPGSNKGEWINLTSLDNVQESDLKVVPEHYRFFTSVFIGDHSYVCSWNNGVYRVDNELNTYFRLTSANTSGFPTDAEPVIAIAENNGRLCYLTPTTFYWSGPGAPEDLTPALGGAGFQTISQHIAGEPRAMISVSDGVLVWTTAGSLLFEFVGGEIVFRPFELVTDVLPLSQSATVQLPSGQYIILTRLGLFAASSAETPQPIAPVFNEFMREYLRPRSLDVARMWYNKADNRIFLSFRGDSGIYVETFVLDLSLDKWGIFNGRHVGMFHYGKKDGPLAYINPQGIASFFLSSDDNRKEIELPTAPGTYKGLNSEVILGFIRAENQVVAGDSVQELQEIVIHRKNLINDLADQNVDEGNVTGSVTFEIDEGFLTLGAIANFDEGIYGGLTGAEIYKLSAISDIFPDFNQGGQSTGEVDFQLASQGMLADTWTGLVPGMYMRIRLKAEEPGESFRVHAMDCTLQSAGQMV